MKKATKEDLIDAFAAERGVSMKEARSAVDMVFELIKQVTWDGNRLMISKFGRFEVIHRPSKDSALGKTKPSANLAFYASKGQRIYEEKE